MEPVVFSGVAVTVHFGECSATYVEAIKAMSRRES